MAKITLAYVRNKVVWPLFSKIVRLEETDEKGYGNCITCGVRKHWKEFQAGHFEPGRFNSILYERNAVHIQCYRCNVGLKGNPRKYNQWMLEKFGQAEIDRLDALSKKVVQFNLPQLFGMARDFKERVDKLLTSKKSDTML